MSHNLTGFNQLKAVLGALSDVQINIERSDGLLVDWLIQQGYNIYITPPQVLARRRPTRAKDDKRDAFLLAHLLRLEDPDCRPYNSQSQIVTHLRQLARAYDWALKQQRRLSNQLTNNLRQYYPVALTLFARAYSLITLAFLERFPTPQDAENLTYSEFEQFLRSQGYSHMKRLDLLYQRLKTPMPRAAMQDGYVQHDQMLIPLLRMLYHQKNAITKEMKKVFLSHPDADWWLSIPGTQGPLTPARMLAWMGDNRSRFPTAKVLQAVAGTVPVTRRSGKTKVVEFRTACSHPLRSAIDDLARQSTRHSGWARAYFQQQLDKGHSAARSYRALSNRWLKIIWTLWQRHETYDEAVHVANRSRKGQRLPVIAAAD
ncbi:MAG: transposase [Chloroflexota bacterium]